MLEALEKLSKLRRALNLAAGQQLKPLKLHPQHSKILYYLEKRGSSSLADLSRATESDPAAVCRTVDLLLKRHLVKEDEHPSDRRRWQISLAPRGRLLARKVGTQYESLAKRMMAGLNQKERKIFLGLLEKILNDFCPACKEGRS